MGSITEFVLNSVIGWHNGQREHLFGAWCKPDADTILETEHIPSKVRLYVRWRGWIPAR